MRSDGARALRLPQRVLCQSFITFKDKSCRAMVAGPEGSLFAGTAIMVTVTRFSRQRTLGVCVNGMYFIQNRGRT